MNRQNAQPPRNAAAPGGHAAASGPRVRGAARNPAIALPLLLLWLTGCVQERIVNYRPALLGSLPDAQTGTPVNMDTGRPRPGAADGLNEQGEFDPDTLRRTSEDGTVTLTARRPYHLMVHVYFTLINNESELFTSQVLSELTREEFQARGRDPAEAFEMLQERQRDVLKLFAAMPQGELTPGVLMEKIGPDVYRLEAVGSQSRQLSWRFIDVTMERGHWRLRWFGP